jgi:anti-sigma B factor antagonist
MTVMERRDQMTDIRMGTVEQGAGVQLTVGGELDLATARRFVLAAQEALTGRSHTTLVVKMSTVTFIDASGIGALMSIRNHARLNDNRVAVTEPSPCVRRLLDLTASASAVIATAPNKRTA